MKNGFKRGIFGLAALAALAGCGDNAISKNVAGPEEPTRITSVEEGIDKLIRHAGNDENLANMVGEAYRRILAAPKIAQDSEVIQIPYNGRNLGDFDFNHNIDFDDFLLFADNFGLLNKDYDLDGNGSVVDFDDFLLFADNFGRRVNYSPFATSLTSDNGDNVESGFEVILNASALDKENDGVNFNWYLKRPGDDREVPIEINGGQVKRVLDEEGEHVFSVKAVDSYGGESNLVSKSLFVRHSGPRLSLPDTVEFDQWSDGQNGGNVYSINLRYYVDKNVAFSARVIGDNSFRHENIPTLWQSYQSKALRLTLKDNVLGVDPVANYNEEHGDKSIEVTARDTDGNVAMDTVRVNVNRVAGFDNHYDLAVDGIGWKDIPTTAYVWVGNSRTGRDIGSDGYESRNPRNWTGPELTSEDRDKFLTAIGKWQEQSDRFIPLNVIWVANSNYYLIYDETEDRLKTQDRGIIFFCDTVVNPGGTGDYFITDANGRSYIGSKYILVKPGSNLSTLVHELLSHGTGMNHVIESGTAGRDRTLFHWAATLEDTTPLDKAVIDSYNEVFQYN